MDDTKEEPATTESQDTVQFLRGLLKEKEAEIAELKMKLYDNDVKQTSLISGLPDETI